LISFLVEIDQYGFFEADTDISAIYGPIYRPIPMFPKSFNSCFLFYYQKYVFYALHFFQKLKNQDLSATIFEIAAISIFD